MNVFPTNSTQNKFGLNFILNIDAPSFGLPITIGYPFTLEFDISRTNYSNANSASLRIYNLSKDTQALLQFDQFIGQYLPPEFPQLMTVTLQAGYGNGPNYPVIFTGTITRAYSVREAGGNFVTSIEAFDGGAAYANAKSSRSYGSQALQAQVVADLISDLAPYGVSLGSVSASINGKLTKGGSYCGNTVDLLRDLMNNNFFIDNLKANVILPTEYLPVAALTLNAQTGLLETPIKQQQWLELKMIFEPRLVIGSIVNVQAATNETYNGNHQVCAIHHTGTISAAVSAPCTTTLGLVAGVFSPVIQAVTL